MLESLDIMVQGMRLKLSSEFLQNFMLEALFSDLILAVCCT